MMDFLSPSNPAEGEERSLQEAVGWEQIPLFSSQGHSEADHATLR